MKKFVMQVVVKPLLPGIAIVGCLFFSGCKKGGGEAPPENAYYFRAKLNGVQKDFLHVAKLQGGGNDNRWEHMILGGYDEAFDPATPLEDLPLDFEIEIWNEGGNITAGTYTEAAGGPYDTEAPNDYDLDGERHVQTSNGTDQYDASESKDFKLIITELSKEKGIKATFTGTLIHEDNPNDIIHVTEGEIYLPYDKVINPR